MKIRILVDVDGVTADFVDEFLHVVYEQTGQLYRPEQIENWDIVSCLDLTPEQQATCWAAANDAGFCRRIHRYPHARQLIDGLRQLGQVVHVTAPMGRSPTWCWERRNWVRYHLGDDPVVFADQKGFLAGHVMVDDKPQNLEDFLEANPTALAILWDQPYNRDEHRFRRCRTPEEACRLITKTFCLDVGVRTG